MTKDRAGRLIGGVFGTVFIQINAGVLPKAVGVPLRLLAAAAMVGLIIGRRGAAASGPEDTGRAPTTTFGRRYWTVVAAEVAALVAGLWLINPVLHTPRATVGWIALVVGVHFFGLATAWSLPPLRTLGATMAVCGLAGLALAVAGVSAIVTAAVGGIVPGVLLLGFAWRGGRPGSVPAADPAPQAVPEPRAVPEPLTEDAASR
ncbi:hypothetical protein [Kitasatospora camelliae]|uniref:Uncharacterized protein n=1 Tax=Kitasatospora camelliae TaxID=3156397 RepID=A0AAU8K5D1_9ACTN